MDLSQLKVGLVAAVKQSIEEKSPTAARVGELLISGGAAKGAGTVKVFGVPVSAHTLGPVLMARACGAGDLEFCNIMEGAHKTDEYAKINPFQQIPGLQDGDVCLGESLACAAYIARKYAPDFYSSDAAKAANIDMAMQNLKNTVGKAYTDLCYYFLGFVAEKPEAGFVEPNATALATIEKWFTVFVPEGQKFVGGDKPCVADLVALPFLFAMNHPVVAEESGFVMPDRAKTFIDELMASVPGTDILTEGFCLKSHIQANSDKRKAE